MADSTLANSNTPPAAAQSMSQAGLLAFAQIEPLARGLSDVQPPGAPGALMAELRSQT